MRVPLWILLSAVGGPQEEAARLAAEVFALEPVDPARALASLDRALALAPRDPGVLKAGLYLHLRLRDLAAAEDAGRALLEVGGADPYAWIWLGNIAFWRRDLDEAEKRYHQALESAGPGSTAEDAKAKLAQIADERAYRARAGVLARRSLALGGLA
ncbi:MAG: tetratricopeptide repeat protein, partial [Planctomycetota bacterium]